MNEKQFLEQYKPGDYPRPSVTVDNVIFSMPGSSPGERRGPLPEELRVLLIKRGGHPFIGHWALPGGFVGPDETVGEAARRELAEETGLTDVHIEQLYTFSKPGRDPRAWVISCAHMALVDGARLSLKAGDDAKDARWFDVKAEERDDLVYLYLSDGDVRLSAIVIPGSDGVEARTIESEGLAFDHAEIIMYALSRLRQKFYLR